MGVNNPKPTPDITAYKTADETVNNSNVLQDDNELVGISLDASSFYVYRVSLFLSGNNTADFKCNLVTSQNADLHGLQIGWLASGAVAANAYGGMTATSFSTDINSTGGMPCVFYGFISTTLACTLKLRWAQNTADLSDTKVLSGSKIELWKEK